MIMQELYEKKTPDGTYVGAKFDNKSLKSISKFIKSENIPNPLNKGQMHSTIVYSRKYLPDLEVDNTVKLDWTAKPYAFEVWETKPNAYNKTSAFCLVMKLRSPDLKRRHEDIVDDHGATHDFEEYIPHVTLSYNVGEDFDHSDLEWTGDELTISKEYMEDLKTDA